MAIDSYLLLIFVFRVFNLEIVYVCTHLPISNLFFNRPGGSAGIGAGFIRALVRGMDIRVHPLQKRGDVLFNGLKFFDSQTAAAEKLHGNAYRLLFHGAAFRRERHHDFSFIR
jgi:hypothetical protein